MKCLESDGRSCVVDEISRGMLGQPVSVAYVYFDYTNPKSQLVDNVVRSLLVQLLLLQSTVPCEIEDLYDEYSRRSVTPATSIFKRHLFTIFSSSPTSFVLFDALDEILPENAAAIMDQIKAIAESGVRVFCTSNTVSVRAQLGEPAATVEIRAHDDDMTNYLTAKMNREWEYDGEFKPEIVQTLVEKAAGKFAPREIPSDSSFLLVMFQLDFVLSFSEPQDSLEALERLPPYLDAAYHEVMQRIERGKAKGAAVKALSWIFQARRPLTIDELREAISIRPFRQTALQPKFLIREDSLLKYCQGLIVIDENGADDSVRTVRFTHPTVRDFLAKAYMDKLLTEADLAKLCLTYLTFDEFELGPCHDTYTLLRQMGNHRLWRYCVENWGGHTRGEAEEDPEVVRGVCNLLASTAGRSSMHQLILSQHGFTKTVFVSSDPVRVLAEEGLATIYKYLLQMDPKTLSHIDQLSIHTPLLSAKDADTDPLLIAVGNGHCHMATALLDCGSDVNVRSTKGETPLHIAARRGYPEAISLLLARGAIVEAHDKRLRTALHVACKYGHREIVLRLSDAGADLNAQDQEGWTPLHYAAAHGCLDVSILLERGSDLSVRDRRGFTALETAARAADVLNFEIIFRATVHRTMIEQPSTSDVTPVGEQSGVEISFDGIRNLPFRSRQRELHRQLANYFPDSNIISNVNDRPFD